MTSPSRLTAQEGRSAETSPWAVFWNVQVEDAIAGKAPAEQLPILITMITDAEHDKALGYGPPQSDIYAVKRRFNAIYEIWVAERLPSMSKGKAA